MNPTTAAQVRSNIDWIFNEGGSNPPTDKGAWQYSVLLGEGATPGWRGPISAHGCGAIASAYAQVKQNDAAMSWLCAAQCHDEGAMNSLRANTSYALEYLVEKYQKEGAVILATGVTGIIFTEVWGNIKGWFSSMKHSEAQPPFPTSGGPREVREQTGGGGGKAGSNK